MIQNCEEQPDRGDSLLAVHDLRTYFHTDDGVVRAVDGVSFDVPAGKTVALVGESGCGKSITAMSVLRLIPSPPGRIESGRVLFRNEDLLTYPEKRMRHVRGNQISMIFQEPLSSLNPVFTIGNQIIEAIRLHQKVSSREARDRAEQMLRKVGIPEPAQRLDEYPHQLSGGMRQRAMIAMALSCNPQLLIADEPTTALDVTVQAQILELLRQLQADTGMSVLMITHDLGVVAQVADYVVVMYAGKVVERAGVQELFADPLHPYTQGLFESLPRLGQKRERLHVIPGTVPSALTNVPGCSFHPRCGSMQGDQRCCGDEPELQQLRPGHWVSCYHADGYDTV